MIEETRGNLLEVDAEALVNTVNCVGVMGKGIALQFKRAFPANFDDYAAACKEGEVRVGRVFVHRSATLGNPKYIFNFPTKRHWRARSRIDDIVAGLDDLVRQVGELGVRSVAIPPLGCGNGGLRWSDVRPLIANAVERMGDEVRVLLYPPKGAPKPSEMPVRTKRPKWTRARAMFVRLMSLYRIPGYRLSHLEVQKLAYFLQEAGEPLKLRFKKAKFGPYADNLSHVLQLMEGHFIRGAGDRSGRAEIRVLTDAEQQAVQFLEDDEAATHRLERVEKLIQGFESPYGMELLGTVHWVVKECEQPSSTSEPQAAVAGVKSWNTRKRDRYKDRHIGVAWSRLRDEGWFGSADSQEERPN